MTMKTKKRTYKLSPAMPRSELLASIHSFATSPVKDAPIVPTSDTDAKNVSSDASDDTSDTDVDAAIAKLKQAFDEVQAVQKTDPDEDVDSNDAKVDDAIAQIGKLLDELDATQKVDDANDEPAKSALPAKTAKLAVENVTPVINPIDDEGNVLPDAVCQSNDCSHLASVHENTQDGNNSGACLSPDCTCLNFSADTGTASDPQGDDADDEGGVEEDDATKLGATAIEVDAESASVVAPNATDDLPTMAPSTSNAPPVVAGSTNMGPAFTIPVMVIEGQDTGDGRAIAVNALEWPPMPMPLMGQATSTHDPSGMDMNAPAVWCGRIDSIERAEGENGTQLIVAKGFYFPNDDGAYFADLTEKMGRCGISADIAADESIEAIVDIDEFGIPVTTSTLTKGTIMGCTVLPFPAFNGAYIVLGDDASTPAIPQKTDDAMNQPDSVTAGGFLIHYMAKEECVPCANGYDVLVASGNAPVRPPKAWFENPNFTLGDGRLKEIFTGRGEKRFGGVYACPFTITDEGEVFGHIAPWGVCHTGQDGACVTPPHSKMNYAQFMNKREAVTTAEGDKVTVGVLTFDTSHAGSSRFTHAYDVQKHYDHTGTAFADVVCGEDEFGIWVHGALRPDIDEVKLRAIRASSPSGDWRKLGGNLELVACLSVNQPGFPVAVIEDGGSPVSLVAAGAYQMRELQDIDDNEVDEAFKALEGDFALRKALSFILESEKERLRARKLELDKQFARRRFESLRRK
jgi:hypothetical protein